MVKRGGERRRRSERQQAVREQVESHMASRIFSILGAEAADRWLRALGLEPVPRWFAEISIPGEGDARFDLNVYAEEWGYVLHHAGRTSWIRVTDVPFVHGRDDFGLLGKTSDLAAANVLLAELESDHQLAFRRANATVRSNVPDAEHPIRAWLLQPVPYSTVKKTTELCGDEMHDGIRCSLRKGHDGQHEHQGRDGRGALRWK